MANLELTFYKGVPFDIENENVLHCSKTDRDTFLATYQMNSEPIEIDKFFFNGTDERCFLNVSLAELPFNVNYLKVVQTLTDSETKDVTERILFFFVNSFRQGAENTVELDLTIDKWQSWFEYEQNNLIINPSLKNALCVQGHEIANGGEEEEIVSFSNSGENITYSSLSNSTRFRLVAHLQIQNKGETCFISQTLLDYNQAVQQIFFLAECIIARYTERTASQTIVTHDYNFEINEVFLVPDELFGQNSTAILNNYDLATCRFYTQNEIVSTVNFYIANLANEQQGASVRISTYFEITPAQAKITLVGTGKTNIELPYNNKTYKIYFNLVCSNDFSIEMIGNKQKETISNDYSMNVYYNQHTNYVATSKNTEEIRKISTVIGGASSTIGLVGSIASGNIIGSLGSSVGIGRSALGYFQNEAKIADLATIPPKLTTNLDNILLLIRYRGLAKFEIETFNKDDIISFDEYFGFKANGFHDTLSIEANTNDRFRYFKCSEIQIIGDFNFDVKKYLENLFKRGVRIWYNKSHYLNSMTQKIPENQGE